MAAESGPSVAPLVTPDRCQWCHMLDGRKSSRPITAGCVHEHFFTLTLCDLHEHAARTRTTWCESCREAGYDEVPVKVITPPDKACSGYDS